MGLVKKPISLLGVGPVVRKYCTARRLKRFVPIANWLPNYKLSFVKNDLIAGITVGLTLVPQALAFAQVANLPPQYGLYSGFIGLFVYTMLGTSKDAGLGPTNLLSMLIGQVMLGLNSQNPIYTSLMSLFGGLVLVLMGFLQLGFLVNMFSIPVISGFTSAAGLIIIINQLGNLFGIPGRGVNPFEQVIHVGQNFTKMNFGDLLIGSVGLVFLIVLQRLPNFTSRRFIFFHRGSNASEILRVFCASRNVLLVILSTLFSFVLSIVRPDSGVSLIGQLPSGLPVPSIPRFSISNESRFANETDFPVVSVRSLSQIVFEDLNMSLIVIPLMTMLELFAITKALGRKNHYKVDHSQELIAVGLANIAGSFFSAFPITAAVTRSALNDQCKVSTPLAGTLSAFVVIIAALFATPVFFFIPKATLAAIITSAGLSLIDLATVAHIWHEWRWDLVPLAATFFVSLCTHMWQGILVGISISLALLLAPVVRLKIVTEHLTSTPSDQGESGDQTAAKGDFVTPARSLGQKGQTSIESTPFQTPPSVGDGTTELLKKSAQNSAIVEIAQAGQVQRIVIVRLQQGLHFPSVDRFTDRMTKILSKDVGQIIIDCQFITGLDFTALQGIRQVLLLASRLNRSVVFARLNDHLRKHIERLDIDHFRHVSRWDDILVPEEEQEPEEDDFYGTQASLNGSGYGESNVDAMVAKRSGKNLEDLAPIPEEQSEQSIEAVITIPHAATVPLNEPRHSAHVNVTIQQVKSDHALLSTRLLAYEPHFFGSAIPLAVGSVSLEDLAAPPGSAAPGGESFENFLRGSRHISYMISDDDSGRSESDSDDDGITMMNHATSSGARRRLHQPHHAAEHVELLEFTSKPSKHGHAASGQIGEHNVQTLNDSTCSGLRLSLRKTPADSNGQKMKALSTGGKLKPGQADSHPQLAIDGELQSGTPGQLRSNADTWHGDALMSKLARSLSQQSGQAGSDDINLIHQITKKSGSKSKSGKSSEVAGSSDEPVKLIRLSPKVRTGVKKVSENSPASSSSPSTDGDEAKNSNEIYPAVIVHSSDDISNTPTNKQEKQD